jgi:uncharacterized membrane protein YfcA
MDLVELSVMFGAAFAAGMINSVAGGGTLISFPALVWLGRNPVLANATNSVALWPGSLASMIGYRRELTGSRKWILVFTAPSILGGLAGAKLLLRTPPDTFAAIVPALILLATILIAAQEAISRRLPHPPGTEPSRRWWIGATLFQFCVAVYGGYFGAGMGILMLAALGLLGLTDIHKMNGMKNFFAVCINGVAALFFAISGAVLWLDGLVMTLGAIAGGYGGAGLARRLGRKFVRRAVVAIGFGMAIAFAVSP